MSLDHPKKLAGEKAVEQIQSGMVVGLGTGSTTAYAVMKIGELLQEGTLTDLICVSTSKQTEELAEKYRIPIASLNDHHEIDISIDGADEVDPQLDLIKGLGGALLREKMVELASEKFIVVIDEGKLVQNLGTRGPLPVEVTQFGWKVQARWLESLGCVPKLRGGEEDPFITDNGNYVIDCLFAEGIPDPKSLAEQLKHRTGVVDHGLFLGMADEIIIGSEEGTRFLKRSS